jgi:hypothetical protein
VLSGVRLSKPLKEAEIMGVGVMPLQPQRSTPWPRRYR